MTPGKLLLMAAWFALAAVLTAVVPRHPIWNLPGGTYVLGVMAACWLAAALVLWWRRPAPAAAPSDEYGAAPRA